MNNWIFQNETIFHHEFDWYCNEDGTFPILKGDLLGLGFKDIFTIGPYRTRLLAYSVYKKTDLRPICVVSYYPDWTKDYD